MSIYQYINYITFLKSKIKIGEKSIYGYRARLADSIGCQRSYLSQVLSEKTHFTLEHAIKVAKFWELNLTEEDYFINLVEYNRAGSQELKTFFLGKMNQIRSTQENLSKRIQKKEILPDEKASILYSSWNYLAVLILVTIPAFRTVSTIAKRLHQDEKLILSILQKLKNLELIHFSGDEWLPLENTIHVPKDSPYNSINHANWRNLAVQHAFSGNEGEVHYTSVCSLSKSDAELIKQYVLQLIDKSREIVSSSEEQEAYCLTFDWFKI